MTNNQQDNLSKNLQVALADKLVSLNEKLGELTIVVRPEDILEACKVLRDNSVLLFDTLIDLCGIDYLVYGRDSITSMIRSRSLSAIDYSAYGKDSIPESDKEDKRFAVIYHLLSIKHNRRLRIKVFAESNEFPVIDSVIDIWPAANWFEREAFDLFGIVFAGHSDLRRLLTDYGFIGNPFRKDFPLSGNVEMRYDNDQKRVIYQPVTIEPREITPRVIREEHYGDSE